MKPDIPAPLHTPDERVWVEAELVRTVLRASRTTLASAPLLVALMVGVLWEEVAPVPLLAWALLALAGSAARFAAVRHYERHLRNAQPGRLLEWFARVRHIWLYAALVWGSLVAIFFDRVPLANQFVCWLMLVGVAMYTSNTLAAELRLLRTYLNALLLTAMGIVGWRVAIVLALGGPYFHFWLMALLGILWQLLLQEGRRAHHSQRRNFELQYRNRQLINSLTRQTQTALEAVEAKNRFLASATHDIRQPVHALGLYADWLAGEPEMAPQLIPKIVESTKAINTLFDALFDLVRLESGSVQLNIADVSIEQLLSELEVQYRPLAQARGLGLRVHARAGSVRSDALLLRRIVGNLLSNAIKYTERGGVLLAARQRQGLPCIEVWDTGVGISPAHQQDIFREFYKVPIHAGTEDGFGLGLYIVNRLTHILGHPMEFSSRVGRGTVFRVVLRPVDPVQAEARAVALEPPAT